MTSTSSKVIIVGAGAFGLSTSLHLKRRGYKDVTVFDYQPYDQNHYDPTNGCDAASADINKIYRCSYGDWKEYQDLAMKGRPIWEEWNRTIASTPAHRLPRGLTPADIPFINGGFIRQNLHYELSDYDRQSLEEMEKVGLRDHIHVKRDQHDMARLAEKVKEQPEQNWFTKLHALDNADGGRFHGFLDTFAGYTRADKACTWARHLCEQAGVKFVLGSRAGRLQDLIVEERGEKRVKGIRTADGKAHSADVVMVACGGWTPSVIPETAGLLEATAGSVVTVQLPRDRPDLWDKYSPEKFPTWSHGMVEGPSPEFGGFYGFPRTPDGVLKIGYRGRKWTNYQTNSKTGHRVSTPTTKYTPQPAVNLPRKALDVMKRALGELFPDLVDVGITDTRMCWYTDSLDDSFVIDYVPGYDKTLFVASGGSGHGFKFLPVLGEHIANQLERKQDQFTPLWKWRKVAAGEPANGLEEGEMSGRNLATLEMGKQSDWVLRKSGEVKIGPEEVRARL